MSKKKNTLDNLTLDTLINDMEEATEVIDGLQNFTPNDAEQEHLEDVRRQAINLSLAIERLLEEIENRK